jgi:hypothetical protein
VEVGGSIAAQDSRRRLLVTGEVWTVIVFGCAATGQSPPYIQVLLAYAWMIQHDLVKW